MAISVGSVGRYEMIAENLLIFQQFYQDADTLTITAAFDFSPVFTF